VVRDDYQDKDKNLQKFVKAFQNSKQVKAALDSDLVQRCGSQAGNKENDHGEFWFTS
jgi:hypothetical protein